MRRNGSRILRALAVVGPLALTVAGCATPAKVTATNPHPNLPANYRKAVADYMKTQMFGSRPGISTAEISDPNHTWNGYDVVCVRFGGGGWPNFSTVRAYVFSNGQLLAATGQIVSQFGQGVVTEAVNCGSEPVFRPFPEWRT
jgi:hypothetical protein